MLLWLLAACDSQTLRKDSGPVRDEPGETVDTSDSADTAETADTADTGDTGDTGDTLPQWSVPDGCGDDLADGRHEECDGADDAACPGVCSAACQCPSGPATGVLTLFMVDVWQADGLAVQSPDGFRMIVDAGDESDFHDFKDALRAEGIWSFDTTLVSHLHADHMGAMDWALEDFPEIGVAWDHGGTYDSNAVDEYFAEAGARRTTVEVGQRLDLGPTTVVEVLHADIGDRDNENNNSVVVRITYGDVQLLLGGDCEYLVCEQAFDPGPIDIYKVHHHGSEDASGPGLLSSMMPSLALISAGRSNDYGHPDDPTLDALQDIGADVWRTDQDGTIRVDIDGVGWSVTSSNR